MFDAKSMVLLAARMWLALGLLVVVAWPAAAGMDVALGWRGYWLVIAPICVLLPCALSERAQRPQASIPRRLRSSRRTNSSMMRR